MDAVVTADRDQCYQPVDHQVAPQLEVAQLVEAVAADRVFANRNQQVAPQMEVAQLVVAAAGAVEAEVQPLVVAVGLPLTDLLPVQTLAA